MLAGELTGPAAAGLTARELEELIDEESRKAVRQLLQDRYDLRALREEQQARKHPAPVTGTGGITRTRLGARDPQHLRTWIVLVNGAEHQPGLIRAEAARRGVTIWGAAWNLHPAGDPAAEDWVAARALTVLAGDSDRAAAEITADAGAAGVIEGACRHLIADRLSIGGARRGLDGAEAILTLRAVIGNGDSEEYRQFHLACEHQRLCPGTRQRQHELGA